MCAFHGRQSDSRLHSARLTQYRSLADVTGHRVPRPVASTAADRLSRLSPPTPTGRPAREQYPSRKGHLSAFAAVLMATDGLNRLGGRCVVPWSRPSGTGREKYREKHDGRVRGVRIRARRSGGGIGARRSAQLFPAITLFIVLAYVRASVTRARHFFSSSAPRCPANRRRRRTNAPPTKPRAIVRDFRSVRQTTITAKRDNSNIIVLLSLEKQQFVFALLSCFESNIARGTSVSVFVRIVRDPLAKTNARRPSSARFAVSRAPNVGPAFRTYHGHCHNDQIGRPVRRFAALRPRGLKLLQVSGVFFARVPAGEGGGK